jgi:hypothetical protein
LDEDSGGEDEEEDEEEINVTWQEEWVHKMLAIAKWRWSRMAGWWGRVIVWKCVVSRKVGCSGCFVYVHELLRKELRVAKVVKWLYFDNAVLSLHMHF